MREPHFKDTILYKMLKSGGFISGQLTDAIRGYNTAGRRHYIEGDPNPDPHRRWDTNSNINAHRDAVTTGEAVLGVLGDVTNLAGRPVRAVTSRVAPVTRGAADFAEDAGSRLGHVLGDMFGKINTDISPYDDADIVSLLNEKEEIEVLNRETERLRRIARIQARKREKIRDMTEQALRSPYL